MLHILPCEPPFVRVWLAGTGYMCFVALSSCSGRSPFVLLALFCLVCCSVSLSYGFLSFWCYVFLYVCIYVLCVLSAVFISVFRSVCISSRCFFRALFISLYVSVCLPLFRSVVLYFVRSLFMSFFI